MMNRFVLSLQLTGLVVGLVTGCSQESSTREGFRVEQPAFNVDPTKQTSSSPALVARGKQIFDVQCAACHGGKGEADGPAAYLLYPKPRNLKKGVFRFTSTWEGTPTDDDIFRVISRGIPGSAMPPWSYLSEEDRWALVHYVKSLSEEPLVVAPAGTPGQGIVVVPPEPPDDEASRAKGGTLFKQICAPCHGPRGQGDGANASQLRDDEGIPIRPRDLTSGVFKGDSRPEHLFRRVVHGIPGTSMPQSDQLAGADGWHVVHFVRSLSSDVLRERAEMKRFRIPAVRVAQLPSHPDSGAWRAAPKTDLHLMPLWWRYTRPEYVTVQAVHDGKQMEILLVWQDVTHNDMMFRPQDFRDAAAIELAPSGAEPPFFAMGSPGSFVSIWMWKADREGDLGAFRDLEVQYPNAGIDSYPNSQLAPHEQPARHALTVDSNPEFVTAWGAGNIVADPTRKSAAEDLEAQGFGTLRARPRADQSVDAHGAWSNGSYRLLFRRALAGQGKGAVTLKPGATYPAAFAIWDGAAGDRDGKKSVTIWQELVLQR